MLSYYVWALKVGGNMEKTFNKLLLSIFVLILFISLFFVPIMYSSNSYYSDDYYEQLILSGDGFFWPIPGYTYISSYFGKRKSPTAGASSYHKGIDIGAPEGSKLLAICNGKITFTGFLGGGGYTITLSVNNIKITYCHVSPLYIVSTGDIVSKGDLIGYVGPKNVYGVVRKSIL